MNETQAILNNPTDVRAVSNRRLLYEISYIRPLIIFLLIIYHVFEMYDGRGDLPESIDHIGLYRYVSLLISGFRIEAIAVVAGYVFAFQSLSLNRSETFTQFAKKKFFRLIVPCIVFSIFYYLIFFINEPFTVAKFLIAITRGCSHLWFLPMLFWCFLGIWIIDRYKPKPGIMLPLLAILNIWLFPWNILGLKFVTYFMFYIYFGYCLWQYKNMIFRKITPLKIIFSIVTYVLIVLATRKLIMIGVDNRILSRTIYWILPMMCAVSGIYALFSLFIYLIDYRMIRPAKWIIAASGLSYGVYVLHQFVLNILSHRLDLNLYFDSYTYPWIILVLTALFTISFSILLLKTRIGRYLVG